MKSQGKSIQLSVVIVSWNTRELLTRCLRSVIGDIETSRIAAEIIVVDNASGDGTVDSLRGSFPTVRFRALKTNLGFAAASNVGIKESAGDAFLLLNPDTEIVSGAMLALLNTLYATPHTGMVSGLLLNGDGSPQSSGYRFPGVIQSIFDFFPLHPRLLDSSVNGRVPPGDGVSPYEIDHPLGACMMVRREVVDRVGLLDERYFMYSEEIDWCQRIRRAGWSIVMAPKARIIHHGGTSTRQVQREMFLELHRSRARYFFRYRSAAFVHLLEVMARTAARWSDLRSGDDRVKRERAEMLNEVTRIYAEARADDDE